MPLNVPAKLAVLDNIIISPNPATNYLTLNIESVQLLPFTFQLYDVQSRLILTGKTSNTQTELNVATLPRGLYVLKVITDKQTVTKKVVLQ
jgi:aminopeptidase YwaD